MQPFNGFEETHCDHLRQKVERQTLPCPWPHCPATTKEPEQEKIRIGLESGMAVFVRTFYQLDHGYMGMFWKRVQ